MVLHGAGRTGRCYTMNVKTYDENLLQFIKALKKVDRKYADFMKSEAENKDNHLVEQCERVFAYELYRIWANLIIRKRSEYILNGEPSKFQSDFYIENSSKNSRRKSDVKYPDLVLHKGQNSDDGNNIVCEIKRSSNTGNNNLKSDIKKLDAFTNYEHPYHWGILLVYGKNFHRDYKSIYEVIKHEYSTFFSKYEKNNKILIVSCVYSDNGRHDEKRLPKIECKTIKEILN